MSRLFGTDGIRGVAGTELTAELATRVSAAMTRVLCKNTPRVLIGMDTRESSGWISAAVAQGVKQMGGEAVTVGVCSTPAMAYLVKSGRYDGGIMISASHNPYIYNGIKLFGSEGVKLSDDDEDRIEELIVEPIGGGGSIISGEWELERYIDYLCSCFDFRAEGMRIGIDCANGSATVVAERVFKATGAECHIISDRPDGRNINDGCGSTCIGRLQALVRDEGLDLGIAFDGDADRCIAVDEYGCEVDGDQIIAILALWLKEQGRLRGSAVVGTVMSNMGLGRFCADNGIGFFPAPVGDRYVLELMRQNGYSLGGEQSGHIIMSDLASTGDGILTALALLCRIKESGKSLSTLAAVMEKYPQYTVNIPADSIDKANLVNDKPISEMIYSAKSSLGDNGRLLIRPSGTEPLIRIMAEGEEQSYIIGLCHSLAGAIGGRLREIR